MFAKVLFTTAAALFLQSATAWSAEPTWDVALNFSSKRNPNGAWKYSGNGTLLNQSSDSCSSVDSHGCPAWENGQNEPDLVFLRANNTVAPLNYSGVIIPSNAVQIDPQSGYSTITWIAQSSGTYSFVGSFVGIDQNQNTHYVHINLLGSQTPIFDASISTYGQAASFSFQQTLMRGQILAFTVQSGATFFNMSTGLSMKIMLLPAN